jgi:sugar-phosphatase
MNFNFFIFDMDGLLVDSELYWKEAEKKIWPELGIEYTERLQQDILGLKLQDIIKIAHNYNPVAFSKIVFKVFDSKADEIYLKKASLMPGVKELLLLLKKQDIKIGLASSSPLRWINMCLKRFELRKFFNIILSAQSMKMPGKPNPFIYNKAMKEMNAERGLTVIFEDSYAGVIAGITSGAHVVAVPDKRWSRGDFSKADLVIKHLDDRRLYKYIQ